MARVLVLVPFPFDERGIAKRRAQLAYCRLNSDLTFDFRPVRAGPATFDSPHDLLLADISMYEAGMTAQDEGYDAVCLDTMSDSGMPALRSVLDIPVLGPGQASYLMALMLGTRFSILAQWEPQIGARSKGLNDYNLTDRCVSMRSIEVPPDFENLLGGKKDVVIPKLIDAGRECVSDGADVLILASTTMHEAHPYLADALPIPVINPGPLTYKLAELALGLGLTHSRKAYPRPSVPKFGMAHAMLAAAEAAEFAMRESRG